MLRDPVYVDTSAVVKLIVDEPESSPLLAYISGLDAQLTTSVITEIECVRAVARLDSSLVADAVRLMERFIVLPLTSSIRLRAAHLNPGDLRSLDAIHLATAVEIQPSLSGFLGYDKRLNDAARMMGLEVQAPV